MQEQTGLFAGKGSFDVKVGEHTQLNGAVIGSTASREHNRLETGTLGFSDIDNQAAYKVEHQSIGASTGGGLNYAFDDLTNIPAIVGNKEKMLPDLFPTLLYSSRFQRHNPIVHIDVTIILTHCTFKEDTQRYCKLFTHHKMPSKWREFP